jgi:hypothetical protein
MVHVAPSQRLRQRQVEDRWIDAMGCVVFNVLGPRGVVVI